MCLKKGISDACILSLSGLNFQFFSLALSSSVSVASWSLPASNPYTMVSSDIDRTFLMMSPKFSNIALWNIILGAFHSHWKSVEEKSCPNGVMKVISSFDSWSSFICQYPNFTSAVVSHLAPCSVETTSSNMVVTKQGFCMALFKSFRFRPNLSDLLPWVTYKWVYSWDGFCDGQYLALLLKGV